MEKEYLLHKYLNGEASEQEIAKLRKDEEYSHLLLVADATSEFKTPEFKKEAVLSSIRSTAGVGLDKGSRAPWKVVLRVAAVLAVIALAYVFIGGLKTNISTGIAEVNSITLPDNSAVRLNSNSSLSYKKRGWEKNRTLELDGEAYFDVRTGNKFDVETSQGIVSVLGTQFNVYSRDTVFNVKCFEGLVSVAYADTLVRVPAGNKLKIENNRLVVYTPTKSKSPSWLNKESSFENATLATVVTELMNQFPVEITSPPELMNKRFTGSFTHDDLELALRSVCEPLRLRFNIKGDSVTIYAE